MIAPHPTSPISRAGERGRGGPYASVCAVQRLVMPAPPSLLEPDRRPALGAEPAASAIRCPAREIDQLVGPVTGSPRSRQCRT